MLKKAFTLIEILIVVILLGILAAVVVPQFTDVSDNAQTQTDRTNVHSLRQAMAVWESQNPGSDLDSLDTLVTAGLIDRVPVHAGTTDQWTMAEVTAFTLD